MVCRFKLILNDYLSVGFNFVTNDVDVVSSRRCFRPNVSDLDTYNTRDVVYLWFAEGDIFKVGITSENLGDERIHHVARDSGFTPEIIMLENVGTVRAKKIESQILRIGKRVSFIRSFPGSSEFRHFSSDDLNKAIELILAG